jgi:hypothetical protein
MVPSASAGMGRPSGGCDGGALCGAHGAAAECCVAQLQPLPRALSRAVVQREPSVAARRLRGRGRCHTHGRADAFRPRLLHTAILSHLRGLPASCQPITVRCTRRPEPVSHRHRPFDLCNPPTKASSLSARFCRGARGSQSRSLPHCVCSPIAFTPWSEKGRSPILCHGLLPQAKARSPPSPRATRKTSPRSILRWSNRGRTGRPKARSPQARQTADVRQVGAKVGRRFTLEMGIEATIGAHSPSKGR